MQVTQEAFSRACVEVFAVLTEHGDGFDGALRALGLDPTATIDVGEALIADVSISDDRERAGFAFCVGMLIGVQLVRGAEV